MKVFYDTEFIEDGRTIDLISIGMVAEDGRELYLVNGAITEDEQLYDRIRKHNWLMEHVVPSLPLGKKYNGDPHLYQPGPLNAPRKPGVFSLDDGDNRVVSLRYIRNAVRDFLTEDMASVELWAWYGAYDHVALAQLFGTMMDLPAGVPMWTNDLQQEIARLGISEEHLPAQSDGVHNALADARHVRQVHGFLASITEGGTPCPR